MRNIPYGCSWFRGPADQLTVLHNTALNVIRQHPAVFASHPLGDSARHAAGSLYIHIPFCFHKCHYCDFYSIVDARDRQKPLVNRLCGELAALAPWAGQLRTIFVGGGTPSLLRVELWEQLLGCLRAEYGVGERGPAAGDAARFEFTVECNPETVTEELMACLAAGGVNRVSVGAQSFNERHLKTLERWHDPANVGRAIELARQAGIERQSLDLIFAVPGQTLDEWEDDLQQALALGVSHLSCYNLTYEPNTAMTARLKRGDFEPAGEDLEAEMYECTVARLRAAGLMRYEVSNYAVPGDESLHNLAYWRQEDWLAAGPSASAHIGGHRWKNVPRLADYLSLDDGGFAAIVDHEPPDRGRALAERIMTGLRLAEGVEAGAILAEAPAALAARAAGWRRSGHMDDSACRWRLTDSGFLIADTIAADLMGAID